MALRAIWQFTDWAVQARMVYGPKRSWGKTLQWSFLVKHYAIIWHYYVVCKHLKQDDCDVYIVYEYW